MIDDKELRKVYQLKNIVRYNNRERIKDESVAEHSFYVALITLMICDKLNLSKQITSDSVIKAILHDMPETELNDITYDVKEKLNLRPLLKTYEDAYFQNNFNSFSELMTSNTRDISDVVVKIADTLSVRQYCTNEKSLGNMNTEIIAIHNNTHNIIEKLEQELNSMLIEKENT